MFIRSVYAVVPLDPRLSISLVTVRHWTRLGMSMWTPATLPPPQPWWREGTPTSRTAPSCPLSAPKPCALDVRSDADRKKRSGRRYASAGRHMHDEYAKTCRDTCGYIHSYTYTFIDTYAFKGTHTTAVAITHIRSCFHGSYVPMCGIVSKIIAF